MCVWWGGGVEAGHGEWWAWGMPTINFIYTIENAFQKFLDLVGSQK